MLREPGTALVSLCFDDGYSVQYDTFYQALLDYGLKATFYVITSRIGMKDQLTWSQLNDLFKEGNEIGSHTHTHPHLTELSTEQLDRELRESKELLKPFGCKTMAYPYGEYDSKVMRSAQDHYLAARGYYDLSEKGRDFGFNQSPPGELHRLKVIPTETSLPTHSEPLLKLPISKFRTAVGEMTQGASEKGAWMIFVFHGRNGASFRLRWMRELSSKFRWMCEYLTSIGDVRILPICDAAELFTNSSSV